MMSPGFALVIALCLVQTAHSQILGLGNGIGCNNGFLPNALGPNALGPNVLGPNFGIAPGVGPLCYGDVAVTGELPVGGSTAVAGQVPVIGYVTFEGLIPAGGLVSVANGCGCNGVY